MLPASCPVPSSVEEAIALLEPPPRGGGRTLRHWRVLATTAAHDLDVARLVEAHLDAATILTELGEPPVRPGELWAVWAARSRIAMLRAQEDAQEDAREDGPGNWMLTGSSPWCSGSDRATHALVTAEAPDGARLFAVDLDQTTLGPQGDGWTGLGMRHSGTATMAFRGARARPVGGPGAYLDRPGFWHGAVAVAAVWFGGAVGAATPLWRRLASGDADAHDRAHAGTVDAALAAAGTVLARAAAEIDAPAARTEPVEHARRRALRARATVELGADEVLRHTGRATGPGPLAHDARHAQHVVDLQVYLRQSHAERDLAMLAGDVETVPEVTTWL